MFEYTVYTKLRDSLTMEQAAEIYEKISESLDPNDDDGTEILQEYLAAADKYAAIRAGWNL